VSIKYRLDPNLTLFRDDVGRPFGVYHNLTLACALNLRSIALKKNVAQPDDARLLW